MQDIIIQNLLSPIVLFFILGVIASIFKSDLKVPSDISEFLSIYLLIAIGIKGGIELSKYSLVDIVEPILGTLFLGIITPIITLFIALNWIRIDLKNAVGLAATYGSVSIVTYGAAITFLTDLEVSYEGYMNAMVVILESPAILISLFFLQVLGRRKIKNMSNRTLSPNELSHSLPTELNEHEEGEKRSLFKEWIDPHVLRESIFGKSVLLLLGSLVIGYVAGENAIPVIKPLFFDLYKGFLVIFLLSLGLLTGKQLSAIKKNGPRLIFAAMLIPMLFGTIGVSVGYLCGLSLGGMTLMGVLAGSASYIAAPAALRASVPKANPSIYLGLSLGVTFPFNLSLGIPLYYQIATLFQ
jgi:hypothetical protein